MQRNKVKLGKALLVAGCLACIVMFLLLTDHDLLGLSQWNRRETKLQQLVIQHSTKEQVIAALGEKFWDYSIGATNRSALLDFFRDEPPDKLVEVRDKVKKYPNILFYSTPDITTWIFLDQNNVMVDYSMHAQ